MMSALYVGDVHHVRRSPKPHKLKYSVFNLMIDLDDWATIGRVSRWFKVDQKGLMSLSRKDYLFGDDRPLRTQATDLLSRHGVKQPIGRIRLFTYPRILGYLFNPVSLYLCDDTNGQTAAIVYEVNNTFGERHHYVIPMSGGLHSVHTAEKAFYVSPFMETSGRYRFKVSERSDRFAVAIESIDKDGNSLNASFKGTKQMLNASSLRRIFLRFPLMTFKIIAGIHLEALKLWLKGLKIYRHGDAPKHPAKASQGESLSPGRKSQ